MSKQLPILFNAEMVRATLAGYKVQTRRPVKPQPPAMIYKDGQGLWYPAGPWAGRDWRCPFGEPGDLLWIQETHWIDWYPYGTLDASGNPGTAHYQVNHPYPGIAKDIGQKGLWQDAASMPTWASRLTLPVKRVWVERVQDIDEVGAQKEGWFYQGHDLHRVYDPVTMDTAQRWFVELWDSIYATKGFGFDTNCYVWACEFEVKE